MPLLDIARGVAESVLRICGVVLVVAIWFGHTATWVGPGWLRSKIVRCSGVLLGLVIIVASGYLGGALQAWLEGGH